MDGAIGAGHKKTKCTTQNSYQGPTVENKTITISHSDFNRLCVCAEGVECTYKTMVKDQTYVARNRMESNLR